MIKLLRAGFFRLKKESMFWLFIFATILVVGYKLLRTSHNVLLDKVLNDYIIFIGLFIAMFVSIFVGKEHSEGIIRNKIIVGHSRNAIYLTNLIISVIASVLCEFIYSLFMFFIGSHIYGKLQMPISQLLMIILNIVLVIITYCSIFNLISHICSEVTISVIICVISFIIMLVLEMAIGQIATQPKYITSSTLEDGKEIILSKEPNPNYPGDDIVNFAKTIDLLFPQGQAFQLSHEVYGYWAKDKEQIYNKEEIEEAIKKLYTMPIYSLIVIAITNVSGLYLFSKKELK